MAIKIAVIGTGIMGRNAINVWQRNSEVEVAAICDVDLNLVQRAAKEFNIPAYFSNHNELLEKQDIDAVHINTPDWAHRDPIIDSLNAGKHVLVEKPMTTDVSEADEIVRTVNKTGKKLQVSFNHRWLSVYHKVYRDIESGKIGECLTGFAKKKQSYTGPDRNASLGGKNLTSLVFILT